MAKSYPLRKVQIQFYDGTETTPATLDITGYSDLPDLPDVIIRRDLDVKRDRGQFSHVELAEDSIDFPEVSITIDMIDTLVTSDKNAIEQWFNKHKAADGTTDLVSTNDGGAKARDVDSGELKDIGLPSDIFTIGMKILWTDSANQNAHGRDYKYVRPIQATVSGDTGGLKITLTFQLSGTYTEITSI